MNSSEKYAESLKTRQNLTKDKLGENKTETLKPEIGSLKKTSEEVPATKLMNYDKINTKIEQIDAVDRKGRASSTGLSLREELDLIVIDLETENLKLKSTGIDKAIEKLRAVKRKLN